MTLSCHQEAYKQQLCYAMFLKFTGGKSCGWKHHYNPWSSPPTLVQRHQTGVLCMLDVAPMPLNW